MMDSSAIDDFRPGTESRMNAPLVDALRELPRFEPPVRMKAEFLARLAGMPAVAVETTPAGFEPPARLRSMVLAELARQQAAQAPRRDAVLREIARGVDPASALDAPLSPAANRWLRSRAAGAERSRPATGKRRPAWSFNGWLGPAASGLAAVLALGIGLRMMLDPSADLQPVSQRALNTAPSPAPASALEPHAAPAHAAQGLRPPPAPLTAAAPRAARAPVASRAHGALESLDTPQAKAAREKVVRDARSPSLSASDSAQSPARMHGDLARSAEAARERQAEPAPQWKLSDDPVGRLSSLPADANWTLLVNPTDAREASEWLQRGLRGTLRDHESLRLETRETIEAGSLHAVPGD
jgi:hypothetical protein